MKSRLSGLMAAALVVPAALWATMSPAAAVGCTYNGCDGKDPQVQGCYADARTPSGANFILNYYVDGDPYYVELRHSDACHARWVRITRVEHDGSCGGGGGEFIRIDDIGPRGTLLERRKSDWAACDEVTWTNMVGRASGVSILTKFCAAPDATGGTDDQSVLCKSQRWP